MYKYKKNVYSSSDKNSELRTQKVFIRPYTHLQNKIQCMNNNVYIMYIGVKETSTKTK